MALVHDFPTIALQYASVAITGGARGIGLATAKAFVARGARVTIGDLDGDLAKLAAESIGDRCQGVHLDVVSRESFDDFIRTAESFSGALDVLVNNAGIMPLGNFVDEPHSVSTAQVGVNLWGPINGMQATLPGMIGRRSGHVVNVASLAGKTPSPGAAVYTATKHAVVGLSNAVRDEVAEHGVSVSVILPSLVRTDLGAGIKMPSAVTVDPEDVAEAIVRTVKHRRASTVVPAWLGTTIGVMNALPGVVQEAARKATHANDVGSDAMRSKDRAGYLDRLDNQVDE